MKKFNFILFTVLFCFLLLTCDNGLTVKNENIKETKKTEKKGREVTGGFDLLPFTDVSLKTVDASQIKLKDFEELVSGTYVNGKTGGSLFFEGDRVSFSVRENGQDITLSYQYDIKAASKNIIYLKPLNKNSVKCTVNGIQSDLSQFSAYISMYGFGEGRIEVSKHLNEESLIKGGTYWKK